MVKVTKFIMHSILHYSYSTHSKCWSKKMYCNTWMQPSFWSTIQNTIIMLWM